MIAWLFIGLFFFFTDALWALGLSLCIFLFFPRLARFAMFSIAFPVNTLWAGTFIWLGGNVFGFCELSVDSWKTVFWLTAIPSGILHMVTADAAIAELSHE